MSGHSRIVLVAKMCSGKTELANRLVQRGYTRLALADQVKDDMVDALNFLMDRHAWDIPRVDRKEIETDKDVFRPLLQWYGTDFVRDYLQMPHHWIDTFLAKVRREEAVSEATGLPSPCIVCDDARFLNEVAALRTAGFFVVKLTRDEAVRVATLRQRLEAKGLAKGEVEQRLQQTLSHPSETEVDSIEADVTIANTSFGALDRAADELSNNPLTRVASRVDATDRTPAEQALVSIQQAIQIKRGSYAGPLLEQIYSLAEKGLTAGKVR